MRASSLVSAFTIALASLASVPAQADWQVNSEFRLHLTESTFDKLIQDFWQSLNGTQKVPVGNLAVNLGDTRLAINGVNVAVNYAFPIPQRVSTTRREWELKSDQISAGVTVNQLVITQHKVIYVGGIPVGTDVTVVCNNLAMNLPAGLASVDATVAAQVVQNQVQLSMPSYHATWPSDAWAVSAISCPEFANVGEQVKAQILAYLANFESVNNAVSAALSSEFQKWSQQASILLLSQQQLPTGVDFLQASFEPASAVENDGDGLILGGTLKFVYPYVAQGQHIEQDFPLPPDTKLVPQSTPQVLIPFAAIKAMMMGEYFAGQLEYTMRSDELPAFQSLLGSFWKKLFGWPDLLHYSQNDVFLFQFLPMGPPSFDNAAAGGANEILGYVNQPLSLRMFAPVNGQYTPYVEFRTLLSGPASMTLGAGGKINFKISATNQPVNYGFAQSYIDLKGPNTYIASSTIASSARTALNSTGINLSIPPLPVGAGLTLAPTDWALQAGGVLKLDFDAKPKVAAPAVQTVRTTNGKRLSVKTAP